MKVYDFDAMLTLAKESEAAMDRIFARDYLVVHATREHERQNIDRFHIHRRDGRLIYRVDYKRDSYSTPRLPLESHRIDEWGKTWGWVLTTEADRIVFHRPHLRQAWILDIDRIVTAWAEVQRWPLWPTGSSRDGRTWVTWNHYPDIAWMESCGIVLDTMSLDTTPTNGIH